MKHVYIVLEAWAGNRQDMLEIIPLKPLWKRELQTSNQHWSEIRRRRKISVGRKHGLHVVYKARKRKRSVPDGSVEEASAELPSGGA